MTANSKILLLNFAVFGLSYFLLQYGLYLNNILALYPIGSNFFSGFQLITHLFTHSNLNHLISNMFMFMIFSPLVEGKIGYKNFWRFYILTGLFSSGFYCLFSNHPIIGASGCVFGILGFFLLINEGSVISLKNSKSILKTIFNIFIIFIILFEVYYSIFLIDDVAHLGHVLGFIFGIFYGKKLIK
jgi:membrane associated rhomboid family serine protease